MADAPDPRRAREEDARRRAFVKGVRRLAKAPGLRDELAEACGDATMPDEYGGDVVLWSMSDPAGQEAATAVLIVLAKRGLPCEFVPWGLMLGVFGAANPATAYEYLHRRVAPSGTFEREPITGQNQIVLRVPADWSTRRVESWVRLTRAKHEIASVQGAPLIPKPREGRTPKLTRKEAIALALMFDDGLTAEWAKQTPPRVEGMGRVAWTDGFQEWLDRQQERHSAERMVRTHLLPALDAGRLTLRTLDIARRVQARPAAARRRRGQNRAT
jgi:hypothetical protein